MNSVDAAIFMKPDARSIIKESCEQKTLSSFIRFILFYFCCIDKYISVMQKICKAFLEVRVRSYDNKYNFFHFLLSSHGVRDYDIHLLKITKKICDLDM